jgi:hypothetical protein
MLETLIKAEYWDNFNTDLYLKVLEAKIKKGL